MTDELAPPVIAARCAELIAEHYFDAAAGERAAVALRAADHSAISDARDLSTAMTQDLRSAVPDLHLRVLHHVDPLGDLSDETAWLADATAEARDAMGGVRRVERLPGNVGLLVLAPVLYPAEIVGPMITAAMSLLADTCALVIDLRELVGGSPDTVALLCSYLLPPRTHLNSMVPRDATASTQSWTLPWVPGARFGISKPVWVLTGRTTFSGGEELAYDLQQARRATIVGDPTGGGANAREGFRVHPHLELTVPVVQARNPHSGTNWETTGVLPDVAVPAQDALRTAHGLALEALDSDDQLRPSLRRELADLRR